MAWVPFEKGDNNYDVIIIGAGISGINFAYRLQERSPQLNYAIIERRHEIGGTWSLFKYPGIRSDSDLYTFGFPWRPWNHNDAIAEGDLIRNYVKESAEEYGIDKKIKFNTKVSGASYNSTSKTWTFDTQNTSGEKKTYKARWMLICTGYYDYENPLQTDIPGIKDFKGQVIHPQFWPEDLDYTNKNVTVIGSGATAITVVPIMADKAKHITMLQRSPSYVMAIPREDIIEKFIRAVFPAFIQAILLRWKWIFAPLILVTYSAWFPRAARATMNKLTELQLPKSIPRDPHFTPRYNPWEQRMCMCPDGDFFKALRSGKASIETGVIENITPNAIKLTSGRELNPDIIITATGLKLQFGGGMAIKVDEKPFVLGEKLVWKGSMLEDLPNASFSMGYVDASWTLGADATAQLTTRIWNQMRDEGVVEVTARRLGDEKETVKPIDLLRLNSTYVQKGKDQLPVAGDRGQWVPRSNFIRDIMTAWYGDIKTSTEWVKA
ncbi:hypothetical protein MRB53_039679 [Persea americana]|nr:hypothetical protein MRB53_039679 [Persea americana]